MIIIGESGGKYQSFFGGMGTSTVAKGGVLVVILLVCTGGPGIASVNCFSSPVDGGPASVD